MKKLLFTPKGKAISDFEVSAYVDHLVKSNRKVAKIGSFIIIDEIRARIAEGRLKAENFALWVTDEGGKQVCIKFLSTGLLSGWLPSMTIGEEIIQRIINPKTTKHSFMPHPMPMPDR